MQVINTPVLLQILSRKLVVYSIMILCSLTTGQAKCANCDSEIYAVSSECMEVALVLQNKGQQQVNITNEDYKILDNRVDPVISESNSTESQGRNRSLDNKPSEGITKNSADVDQAKDNQPKDTVTPSSTNAEQKNIRPTTVTQPKNEEEQKQNEGSQYNLTTAKFWIMVVSLVIAIFKLVTLIIKKL